MGVGVSLLDDIAPFTIWDYDLRGSWVLEFSALISEGRGFVHGGEWDDVGQRSGERWHGDERLPIPFHWSLPWVSDFPPSRAPWSPS